MSETSITALELHIESDDWRVSDNLGGNLQEVMTYFNIVCMKCEALLVIEMSQAPH